VAQFTPRLLRSLATKLADPWKSGISLLRLLRLLRLRAPKLSVQLRTPEEFHDFAGSIVVHAVGGWIGFSAVLILGPRLGRYDNKRTGGTPPSSIPWLAMGSWLLCIGWFGFNGMSAQSLKSVSGLVAMNSLMAMAGGIIAAMLASDGDPGFIHNGALAGLVAVCAGSDVMHPIGIFGLNALGGIGGVSVLSQLFGSILGAAFGAFAGYVIYTAVDLLLGLRLTADEERRGADLAVHKIGANPEEEVRMGHI
jgi:Amt family ammonium transporter